MSVAAIDMNATIAPKSDQINADDLISGPRTVTVTAVTKGSSAEQPVNIVLAEFPDDRPFKPCKTVRRVIVAAWGLEAASYVGKRMTLYADPTVKWGGQDVGGIRIQAMSHIDQPLKLALTVTRGKRAAYVVQPLPDTTPVNPAVSAETLAELTATFRRKDSPEDKWLAFANHYTRGAATALEVITEDQARVVLAELNQRPDVTSAPSEAARAEPDQCAVCGADPARGQAHDDAVHEAAGV